MNTRTVGEPYRNSLGLYIKSGRLWRMAPWEVVACASVAASIGTGWAILARETRVASPFLAALVVMVATFAGWYVWAFFAHLVDTALFGGHADYAQFLDAFAGAYGLQALSFFTFTHPLGWVWISIAAYATVVAWGIVGPRQLGICPYKAIVSATLGMLIWLACLVCFTLLLSRDGLYLDVGAFLA